MKWKSKILSPYAKWISHKISADAKNAVRDQERILLRNLGFAQNTLFGKQHDFKSIHSYAAYKKRVPLQNFEHFRPFVNQVIEGKKNVLWPGIPKYIVGTAGTTSGIKHIPLSKQILPIHIKTAVNAGIHYAYKNGIMDMFDGHLIFLTGSPQLKNLGKIPSGRLSGIVNHEIPRWLRSSQIPSFKTNCIEDWETKISKIAEEALDTDLRMISGISPWLVMFFQRLLDMSGKENIIEIFPHLKMIIHGGVSYEPYKKIFQKYIGKQIPFVETYPATEAFVGFQDGPEENGLLLNSNAGVHFEFIPLDEISSTTPTRLSLKEVELDQKYALVINNNSGLWAYMIGDAVQFTTLAPYRLKHVGRSQQYLSAFGEHLLAHDVESAMTRAANKSDAIVKEFSVAPFVSSKNSHHQWLVEFEQVPSNPVQFAQELDREMQKQNFHYKDLVRGNVIQPLQVLPLNPGVFQKYFKAEGKLGGQNKVPRLSDNRKIADSLLALQKEM